jgi:hypothetical protein
MANRRFIDFPIASTVGDSDIILIWQSGANKQTTKATFLSGLPENLDELNDVAISGLTNGQILRYDSVTGKWENTDQGNLDLNDLNDVSIVSPSNGQVLVYNSSTGKWENSSGGYVPYTGAVTTVDLGAQGLLAGYIGLDTSVASVPDEQGLIYWDDSRSTAALIMNGTLQHIGQDTFFYVKNSTGSSIPKGTAVRFDGTDGASGHIKIAPFLANGTYPSNYFMGVTAETIANGAFGQVMHFGELDGINTSTYTAGALLYASTSVAGGFQTTVPVAPNNIVLIAAAINSKNNGAIIVRPTYGSNINQDEGVKITSPTTGDLLQLQAGGLWENKTKAQILGGTSAQFVKGDGSLDSSTYGTGTVTSVGLSSATSGVTIGSSPITTSGTITLAIATASGSQNGLLSSTDWTTFNGKQNALTNPVTGTGTTNTLAKFTGSTTIGNSLLTDNGTNAGYNNAGVAARTFIIQATSGRPLALEVIENANVHAIYFYPNNSGFNRISSDYMSGGVFLPLSLTGRENNADLVLQTSGNVTIGTTTDAGFKLDVNGTGRFSGNLETQSRLIVQTASSPLAPGQIGFGGDAGLYIWPKAGATYAYTLYSNTGNEVMRIPTGTTIANFVGNVGIGTASPLQTSGGRAVLTINGSSSTILNFGISGTLSGYIYSATSVFGFYSQGDLYLDAAGANRIISLTNGVERMLITSVGDVYFGNSTVSVANTALFFTKSNGNLIQVFSHSSGTVTIQEFYKQGSGLTGSITYNGTNTLYNATSDYRLKEDLKDYNALEIISKLKSYDFKWKNTQTRDFGMIAHELQEVLPNYVSGKKDELTNDKLVKPQVVDYSKIVPLLIKSIQELKQEIDTLKN